MGSCFVVVAALVAARLAGPPTRGDVLRRGVQLYRTGREDFATAPLLQAAALLAPWSGATLRPCVSDQKRAVSW